MEKLTYVSHQSYLFKGTVRENLLMGAPGADDDALWAVLERVNLADFLRSEDGLETQLLEKAANLSGGQCPAARARAGAAARRPGLHFRRSDLQHRRGE